MPIRKILEDDVSERIAAFKTKNVSAYEIAISALETLGRGKESVVEGLREIYGINPERPRNLALSDEYLELVTNKHSSSYNPALAQKAQNGITPEFAAEIAKQLTESSFMDAVKKNAPTAYGHQVVKVLADEIRGEEFTKLLTDMANLPPAKSHVESIRPTAGERVR